MRSALVFVFAAAGLLISAAILLPARDASAERALYMPVAMQQSSQPGQTPPTHIVPPQDCVTAECHVDIKRHRALHGPVSVNACDACHTLVSAEEHTFRFAREGEALCAFCHDMNIAGAAVVHEPVHAGECIACHDPHGGPDPMLLKAPSASQLCASCHEDVIGESRWVHGPVAAGACMVCHAPHASDYKYLLSAQGPELCNSCHVSTAMQLETLRHIHEPAGSDCQTCHYAHASDHEMILRQEAQTLCLSCHENIQHIIETAPEQHSAVTADRHCLNCHEPHASDHPGILLKAEMQLCFDCHNREIRLDDGAVLSNIEGVIRTGTSLHGPIAQGSCGGCHEVHGGKNFRLLTHEYPREFYAPFEEASYALCFSCHNADLVRDPQTTALTDFRNGAVNLHYLHVNRDRKGRTCRACHETHASSIDKHMSEAVPFGTGGWMLPINFEKTPTGGTCAPGCHVPYDYDRVNPINYSATRP